MKPKEERKKSKKRAALKGEQPNSSAMDENATAAAQEDNKKKKEEELTFMKDLCGADGEGKHPELPLQVDLVKVNRCRESHMLKASNAAKLMKASRCICSMTQLVLPCRKLFPPEDSQHR